MSDGCQVCVGCLVWVLQCQSIRQLLVVVAAEGRGLSGRSLDESSMSMGEADVIAELALLRQAAWTR